jgi:DNA-binding CsgD family transcriptional regulator
VGRDDQGFRLEFVHTVGPPSFERRFQRYVDSSRTREHDAIWTLALRPQPRERNRAIVPASLHSQEVIDAHPLTRNVIEPEGLHRHHNIRLLVCDGPLLCAWVGAYSPEPYGPRERRLLSALAEPLRERLALERRLRDADLFARGFEVAVDAMDAPAFLVRHDGAIVHANALARALLDAGASDVLPRLRAARAGKDASATVVPLSQATPGSCTLVVLAAPSNELDLRLQRAAREFALTPRQTEVLRYVATGDANKTIAERLACSLVTIEVHVSAILKRARVDSRSALVARFWTLR